MYKYMLLIYFQNIMGSTLGQVNPKTIILVFAIVGSLLSTQH